MILNNKTNQKKRTGRIVSLIALIAVLIFAGIKTGQNPALFERIKESGDSMFNNSLVNGQATERQYNNIKIGMTLDEVKSCLGDNVMLVKGEFHTYTFVVKYLNGEEDTATLIFNNDSLVQKELFSQQRSLSQ